MARPTTKESLLSLSNHKYHELVNLIDTLSNEEQLGIFPFEDRDRNIRDVLIHLYEWHQLLLYWGNHNLEGDEVTFLPSPYNWKNYGEMNIELWKKHQKTSLQESKNLLNDSHKAVIEFIQHFNDDVLFIKKHFNWTGTTSLGSYCVSATSSHYDWAIKKIKQYKKLIQ